MRSLVIAVLLAGASLAACSKKDEATTTTSSTAVAAPPAPVVVPPPPPTAAPAADIETTPEMKAFMAMLDGTDGAAGKALKKYGSKTTQTNDLGMYALKNPKVTKSEKLGVMQCYTFESSAGVMKHTSRTCWDSTGKIAQITDKSE
jgi:hypothetical protein